MRKTYTVNTTNRFQGNGASFDFSLYNYVYYFVTF